MPKGIPGFESLPLRYERAYICKPFLFKGLQNDIICSEPTCPGFVQGRPPGTSRINQDQHTDYESVHHSSSLPASAAGLPVPKGTFAMNDCESSSRSR